MKKAIFEITKPFWKKLLEDVVKTMAVESVKASIQVAKDRAVKYNELWKESELEKFNQKKNPSSN